MTIKKLRHIPSDPPPAIPKTPRCEAVVSKNNTFEADWRVNRYGDRHETGEDPMRCIRPSVVELDGKNYCRLHAGHLCLDMYLQGKLKEV